MANTVIGSLRVVLAADTAAYETGLKGAEKNLASFARSAKAFATAAAAAIGVAAISVGASVKHMINEADEIGKASQKFGVPVEQLSALKYAADLADVSFESLGKGLGKLSRAMFEGAVNPAGEAAKTFQALGVSLKDGAGNVKNTEKVFTDIAQKFSTMEDGAEKTALAIKVFGKSGADLIPLLNAGAGGLKEMTDRARALGIVISGDTAAKAEKFNDTMKDVTVALNAIGLRVAEALLPRLQQLSEWLVEVAKGGSKLTWIFENLISDQDIQNLQFYGQSWENLLRIWGALKGIGAAAISGSMTEIKAALASADDAIETNKKKLEELRRSWLSLGSAGAFDSLDNLPAQMAKIGAATTKANTAALAQKSAVQSFIEATQKSIDAQLLEAQTMGAVIGVRERMKVMLDAENVAKTNNVTLTQKQRAEITALSVAAEQAALKVAGARMTQEALTPWEEYKNKLKEINAVLAANPGLQDAAANAAAKAGAAMTAAYGGVAATAAGQFSDFFKTFGKGNKEMFAAAKAFSISEAVINTYVGVTKAIAQGGVFGMIMGAGVLAAGMAQVAKIMAEKPPTFALGGAMRIGGAGGIDTQRVSFMASPGETVRVDQNKYGEGGAGRTVTLAGINARDYYRGDVLRDFVANLNEAIGDGLKIKVA